MSNFQKAFHIKKKIAKAFLDAEVNGVEVIMKQNAGVFVLRLEIVWHLALSEPEHRVIIIRAHLSGWGNRERSQSLRLHRAGRNLRYFCLSAEQLGTSQTWIWLSIFLATNTSSPISEIRVSVQNESLGILLSCSVCLLVFFSFGLGKIKLFL